MAKNQYPKQENKPDRKPGESGHLGPQSGEGQ